MINLSLLYPAESRITDVLGKCELMQGGLRASKNSAVLLDNNNNNRHQKEQTRINNQTNEPSEFVLTKNEVGSNAYASLLRKCGDNRSGFGKGKHLHASLLQSRHKFDMFLSNLLVQMYGSFGALDSARVVFDTMPKKNVFSGNIMIAAYVQQGKLEDANDIFYSMEYKDVISWSCMIGALVQCNRCRGALILFAQMQLVGVVPNKVTFLCLIDACGGLESNAEAKKVHALVLKSRLEFDVVVGTAIISMYGKCGSLDSARQVFDKLHDKNMFSCNTMIASYSQCGNVEDARVIFDRMAERDVISWSAMIAAYVQQGYADEAFMLFYQMRTTNIIPNKVTLISLADACSSLVDLARGKYFHAHITNADDFKGDIAFGTCLINMYGKCGSVSNAMAIFNKLPRADLISWTAIVAAHAWEGNGKRALELYQEMLSEGFSPNKVTFISILDACAVHGALVEGRRIHRQVTDIGYKKDVLVSTAIVNMYSKCGKLEEACSVFDEMQCKDTISWNAMIAAYAQYGVCTKAIEVFQDMQINGLKPDTTTFVSILCACSHAGMMSEGCHGFVSLYQDYRILPAPLHCNCIIDLLGRAGKLDEALDFVTSMPLQLIFTSWMALLNACYMHDNVKQGRYAAAQAFKLDPHNAAPYVLLSNLFSAANMWQEAALIRKRMKDKGLKQERSYSLLVVEDTAHQFFVGSTDHPRRKEIFDELHRLKEQIRQAGYTPETKVALYDNELFPYSTIMAIAFGFICTPLGTALHVIKNLRICPDCHVKSSIISKIIGNGS